MRFMFLALTAFVSLAVPRTASGCLNGVELEVDPEVGAMQSAERALTANRTLDAARAALRVSPDVRSFRGGTGIARRAARVVALAVTRLGGSLPGVSGFSARSDAQRTRNLTWAIATLTAVAQGRANDPVADTDLAEALARNPATRGEGMRRLEALASRELVTSAHAWLLVAEGRAAAQQAARAELALDRCRAMSRSPAMCVVRRA
jgi:hypothetical protein